MKVAITGGIAAGKSTVHKRLVQAVHRPNVYDGDNFIGSSVDDIVAGIYADLKSAPEGDQDLKTLHHKLMSLVGTVDKAKVSQACIGDARMLKDIEDSFADLAGKRVKRLLDSRQNIIMEFPLLLEKGYAKYFDYIINVEAPQHVREARALERPGMTTGRFSFVVNKQATDKERRGIAHYTFVNAAPEDLETHVSVLAARLLTEGQRIGIVSGSFDPVTQGHMWLIERGVKMMDHVVVLVANNPAKKGMFSLPERIALIREACESANLDPAKVHVAILPKQELVINIAAELQAQYIIRGLRNTTDFEYEHQIDLVQSKVAPWVETLYFMTPRELTEVSSSMVKSLYGLNGWEAITQPYVPECVLHALRERLLPPVETSSTVTSTSPVLPA